VACQRRRGTTTKRDSTTVRIARPLSCVASSAPPSVRSCLCLTCVPGTLRAYRESVCPTPACAGGSERGHRSARPGRGLMVRRSRCGWTPPQTHPPIEAERFVRSLADRCSAGVEDGRRRPAEKAPRRVRRGDVRKRTAPRRTKHSWAAPCCSTTTRSRSSGPRRVRPSGSPPRPSQRRCSNRLRVPSCSTRRLAQRPGCRWRLSLHRRRCACPLSRTALGLDFVC